MSPCAPPPRPLHYLLRNQLLRNRPTPQRQHHHGPPYARFDLTREPDIRKDPKPRCDRRCWELILVVICFGLGLLLGAMLFP
jgi:hypothetical protein